jgi:hypothetical protein
MNPGCTQTRQPALDESELDDARSQRPGFVRYQADRTGAACRRQPVTSGGAVRRRRGSQENGRPLDEPAASLDAITEAALRRPGSQAATPSASMTGVMMSVLLLRGRGEAR